MKQEISLEIDAPTSGNSYRRPYPAGYPINRSAAAHSYEESLPQICYWNGRIHLIQAGTLNALRFITKNILTVVAEKGPKR